MKRRGQNLGQGHSTVVHDLSEKGLMCHQRRCRSCQSTAFTSVVVSESDMCDLNYRADELLVLFYDLPSPKTTAPLHHHQVLQMVITSDSSVSMQNGSQQQQQQLSPVLVALGLARHGQWKFHISLFSLRRPLGGLRSGGILSQLEQ